MAGVTNGGERWNLRDNKHEHVTTYRPLLLFFPHGSPERCEECVELIDLAHCVEHCHTSRQRLSPEVIP